MNFLIIMKKSIILVFGLILFFLSACVNEISDSSVSQVFPKSGKYRVAYIDDNGNERISLSIPQYLNLVFERDGYGRDSFELCFGKNMNMDMYALWIGGSTGSVEIKEDYLICKDTSDGVNMDIVYSFRILSEIEVQYDESKSAPIRIDVPKAYQLKDGTRFRIPTEEESSHVFSRKS